MGSHQPQPKPNGFWEGLSTLNVFNGFTLIIIVRTVFEYVMEEHTLSKHLDLYPTLATYAHIYISWMCMFITFAVIMSVFLQTTFDYSLRLVLLFSPVIITVPFVDYFLSGGSEIYYAHNFKDLFYNVLNLFNPCAEITMVTTGVRLEVFLVTVGSIGLSLVYFKTGLLRALGLASSLYATIFVFGYLPALMPNLVFRDDVGYFPIYLPVSLVVCVLVMLKLWRENPNYGKVMLHLLFPSRLIFYFLLVVFGMVFTAKRSVVYPEIFYKGGSVSLLFALFSIALLFVWAKIQNDVHDRDIDNISCPQRPVIPASMAPENAKSFGSVFLLPSFAFALGAERYFLILWVLIYALSALYSDPPFRLRRFYPIGHYVLSLIGASVFMAGACLAGSRSFITVNNVPHLTICVFCSFFFLSHIKDLKDIEGDRHGGVMNVYNLTRCPRVVAVLAICGFVVSLCFGIRLLGIPGIPVFSALGIYIAVAVTSIAKTSDLRRLDWIIPLSLALLSFIAVVWLATDTPMACR